MKFGETIALEKKDQKKVARQTARLKTKIKTGEVSIKEDKREKKLELEKSRGLIYVGHLPHGFFEEELEQYFEQFGKVTNVKVGRSKRTGNSKGFGYVEFAHPEVAKIAADSMNNYLMFKKKVVASFVPFDKRPRGIFHGNQSMPSRYSTLRRRTRVNNLRNAVIDDEKHLKKSQKTLTKLEKKLKKINQFGIDFTLTPKNIPEGVLLPESMTQSPATSSRPKTSKSAKRVMKTMDDEALDDSLLQRKVKTPRRSRKESNTTEKETPKRTIKTTSPKEEKLKVNRRTPRQVQASAESATAKSKLRTQATPEKKPINSPKSHKKTPLRSTPRKLK